MKINLIAIHYSDANKQNIVAFRLLDADNGQVMDQPYNKVLEVVCKGVSINGIEFDKSNKKLKGSNGAFDRYPGIVNGMCVSNPLIIIASIDNVGYKVSNYKGDMAESSTKSVIGIINRVGIANGKLVTKDGKQFVSAICGNYDNIPFAKTAMYKEKKSREFSKKQGQEAIKKLNEQLKKDGGYKSISDDPRLPKVVTHASMTNSRLKEVDENTGMTVEQKLTYVMLQMKVIRPFYYTIFKSLNKMEAGKEVSTMGVSLDTLYFSPDFIKEMSLSDLLFVCLHEVCHIAMKHRIRELHREHDIWNQSCDYYINKQLAQEFGLREPGDIREVVINGNSTQVYISLPTVGLFNNAVKVEKDTPEVLYEELHQLTQNQQGQQGQSSDEQGQSSDGQQSGQGQSSDGQQSGQGQSSDGQQSGQGQSSGLGDRQSNQDAEKQNNNSNGLDDEDADDNDGASESELEDLANGNSTNSNSENTNRRAEDSTKQMKGSQSIDKESIGETTSNISGANSNTNANNSEDNNSNKPNGGTKNDLSEQRKQGRLVGKEFRGQQIPDIESDIVDDAKSKGMSDEQKKQAAQSILNRAVTIYKQTHSFGGDSADFLERIVEKELAPKINWKSLLKNKLTLASQKVNTFSAPDKRFRTRGMIMPGPKKLENDSLENIKICIDTSGSITPKDLGIALAQVKQLLDTFKAKAELMYWDTRIRAVYPFEDVKELLAHSPAGGGGTDANCIFDYFENNQEYKNGKKKQPSIIIIFTDGYFGTINPKYKKYKDTIWVIHDNTTFKAPFGSTAPLKVDD